MKIIGITFFLLLLSNASLLANCYCFKVKVRTKTGVAEGHFSSYFDDYWIDLASNPPTYNSPKGSGAIQLLSTSDDLERYQVAASEAFSKSILSALRDSLMLHSAAVLFSEKNVNPSYDNLFYLKLLGAQRTIALENISAFQITEVSRCTIGVSVLTELKERDQSWVNTAGFIKRESVGNREICIYEAVFFEEPTAAADAKIDEFKQYLTTCMETQKWDNEKINAYIAQLKEFKIVIAILCSC